MLIMGTPFCLIIFFQVIWASFIGARPRDVKVSMAHTILNDHLAYKRNNVVYSIWQQEPATVCDIEKPSEKILTNKQILQFNFNPYLCVILYDASVRYLEQNTSHNNTEINSGIAQEIIKKFSRNTFCQKMNHNKWFTTIEQNKLWVSNFSNDMKNNSVCERYCVRDIVNPICAYTLWLDSSIKKMKDEVLHPSSLNAEESQSLQSVLTPPKKEEAGASIEEQVSKRISNAHNAVGSTGPNENVGNVGQLPDVHTAKQTPVAIPRRDSNTPSAFQDPVSATSAESRYTVNSIRYPDLPNVRNSSREALPDENNHSETVKAAATSLPVLSRTSELEKVNSIEDPSHINEAPVAHVPQDPKEDIQQNEKNLTLNKHNLGQNSTLTFNSSTPEITSPRKDTQIVSQTVSGPEQGDRTKPSGTTSSGNSHQGAVPLPEGSSRTNVGSSPPVSDGENNIEGLESVSGDHKTSTNVVEGNEPDSGGQVGTSVVASHGDSPKPSVLETSKIPDLSQEKADEERMNTTVPENVTKEVSGSPLGGSTETKPALHKVGKTEPEAANHAFDGDARAISGEPDNHEEQNALDDSQVENGDSFGEHGGDPTQDRDDAVLDMDQEFPTEPHRYNEGDNDEPSRPDGSTKLSNNNNNKDYTSDEDEGPWPPGRIPINDAEGGYAHDRFVDAEDSHFFAYFMTMIVLCILGYLIFHNKQKILALALEGRVRKGTRRRPSTSGYRKLDSNLEEAVTSSCTGSSVTHVIY